MTKCRIIQEGNCLSSIYQSVGGSRHHDQQLSYRLPIVMSSLTNRYVLVNQIKKTQRNTSPPIQHNIGNVQESVNKVFTFSRLPVQYLPSGKQ